MSWGIARAFLGRHWPIILIGLAIGAAIGLGIRLEHLRAYYRGILDETAIALQAAGFRGVKLDNIPGDVKLLDADRRRFHAEREQARGQIKLQNASIDRLADEGRHNRATAEANLKLYRETERQRDAWMSKARAAATRTERLSAEQEVQECDQVMDALYRDGF